MDYWCGGEDFGVDSSVPTTCATLTILIVMPSVLMSLISIAQIWFYRSQLQDQSDVIRGWNQSLCVYAAFCLAEVLFSVVFSMDDKKTPALLVGIASHCIAWTLLAAKAVHAVAATRHRLVVDLTSWGFYVVDFIGIGLLALGQFAEARTPLNLAAAVCNFLLGLAVLMFCFYIQYLNSRQTYRALKGGSGGGNDCIRNCYEYFLIRLFSERRSQRYSFETATEEGRRSFWSIHSDTKSWWGDSINDDGAERAWPSVNQPLLIDDATREGLMFAAGGHNSVVVESAVLSALERRLAKPQFAFDNGNNAGYLDGQAVIQDDAMVMTDVLRNALERRKRKDRSGGGTDIFSDDFSLTAGGSSSSAGGNMQEFSVIIHRWALLRERSSISADLCDSSVNPLILSPAGFIDTDASLGSDAVIDLESGGSVHDPNQRQYTRKKNRGRSFSGNSINPDDSSGQVPGSSADAAQVEFEICIRCGPCAEMEWWGRSKGVHPTLNKWTVWKTALQIEEFHRSMLTLYGDHAPRRPPLHTSRLLSVSQPQDRTARAISPSPSARRTSLSPESSAWRSGALASPGETVERGMQKSSSHSSLPDESGVSREEIAADMRSIAGYLRAILNQPSMHCPVLCQFLEVPDHLMGSFRGSKSQRSTEKESEKAQVGGVGADPSAFVSAEGAVAISEASAVDDTGDDVDADYCQQWQNQDEEKWRKLYMNLRRGAKPREIMKRCYVFEGCVTGADIVKWLTSRGSIGSVKEAESIGESLVKVGRLIPVCLGLISGSFATEAGVDAQANSFSSLTKSGSIHTGGICDPGELASTFCNSSSYIYTYPGPSKPNSQKNKPRFHLFGDIISVSIPGMMRRTMEVENSAETLGFVSNEQSNSFELRDNVSVNSGHSEGSRTGRDQSPRSPPDGIPADLDTISSDGTDGYIEYEIKSQNSNEHWNVYRRYKEFVALNRVLHKSGIRPKDPLPSQLLGKLTQQNNPKRLEERRVLLEAYLRSAITAVVQAHIADSKSAASSILKSGGESNSVLTSYGIAARSGKFLSNDIEKAMSSLAKFLDKDFDKLRLVQI